MDAGTWWATVHGGHREWHNYENSYTLTWSPYHMPVTAACAGPAACERDTRFLPAGLSHGGEEAESKSISKSIS